MLSRLLKNKNRPILKFTYGCKGLRNAEIILKKEKLRVLTLPGLNYKATESTQSDTD